MLETAVRVSGVKLDCWMFKQSYQPTTHSLAFLSSLVKLLGAWNWVGLGVVAASSVTPVAYFYVLCYRV